VIANVRANFMVLVFVNAASPEQEVDRDLAEMHEEATITSNRKHSDDDLLVFANA
jgi:hypothetical protein